MRMQVLGEVSSRLNYDELVVHSDDAIRPPCLVMCDMSWQVTSMTVELVILQENVSD